MSGVAAPDLELPAAVSIRPRQLVDVNFHLSVVRYDALIRLAVRSVRFVRVYGQMQMWILCFRDDVVGSRLCPRQDRLLYLVDHRSRGERAAAVRGRIAVSWVADCLKN
jgi:hypothetical protein